MKAITSSVLFAALAVVASPGLACGLAGAPIPVGTPIQQLTITGRDRPVLGFGGMGHAVRSAAVVAAPCHGTLTATEPLGFRYAPTRGFVGRDMYAVQGCFGPGRCSVTAAIVTVMP